MPPSPPFRESVDADPPVDETSRDHSRRDVLAVGASAALAGLAGCLGDDPPRASDAPWPMVGYDAGRTNHRADAEPPLAEVSEAWRTEFESGSSSPSQPLAYDDLVVVANDGGMRATFEDGATNVGFDDRGVIALAREDGAPRVAFEERGNALAMADADGYRTPTLIVGNDGDVTALDATGGVDAPTGRRLAERWRASDDRERDVAGGPAEDAAGRTPVARDGVVYHGGRDHALVARDAASGRARWTVDAPRSDVRFAVGEHVYASEFGDSVRAFDPTDGSVVWQYDGDPNRWTSVATRDGVVYANDGRGITALDATDGGTRIWQTDAVDTDYGVPTVTAERVLLAGIDATFGFDRDTGQHVWKRAHHASTTPHLAAAGELAFVPTDSDGLVALDAATGRTAWTHSFDRDWNVSPPIVADGRVYVSTGDAVVCLEGSR